MKLDKIWRLNDKTLVTYFSEPSSNELTRNFAFTCALIPQECAETFTSFGGELKARNAIKEHLLNHLRQLVTRSRGIPVVLDDGKSGNEITLSYIWKLIL